MDQMQGVRTIIDRLGLPPRIKFVVAELEKHNGPLEQLPEAGAAEVRQIRGYVDGENLLAAIVAHIVSEIPAEELDVEDIAEHAAKQDERDDYTRWSQAAEKFPDQLVMLLISPTPEARVYIAYDSQANRITSAIHEHEIILGQHTAVSLPLDRQLEWAQALVNAGLDVLLVEETAGEEGERYTMSAVLDMGLEPQGEGEATEEEGFRPPPTATPVVENQAQQQTTDTTAPPAV